MVKEANTALSPFWRDLFSVGVYKRSQGRVARQVTLGALALALVLGAWSMKNYLEGRGVAASATYAVSGTALVVGLWFGFRLINMPKFADFLIAVEAEMSKVTWPTKTELFRSTIVVLVMIVAMTFVLFLFDGVWRWLLTNVLRVFGT